LVDVSANYDLVVHRDVFGMLAHQLDAERVTRYHRPSFFSFTPDGMFRIYLVDWTPHPNAECAARGYGTTTLVDFGGDPLGLNTNVCIDNHSLYPLGDGEGAAVGAGVCVGGRGGRSVTCGDCWAAAFGETSAPQIQPVRSPRATCHQPPAWPITESRCPTRAAPMNG